MPDLSGQGTRATQDSRQNGLGKEQVIYLGSPALHLDIVDTFLLDAAFISQ
jgi:hypothetical protein